MKETQVQLVAQVAKRLHSPLSLTHLPSISEGARKEGISIFPGSDLGVWGCILTFAIIHIPESTPFLLSLVAALHSIRTTLSLFLTLVHVDSREGSF
jgi:S-adenosylmethionine:tRNA-ribosyltransferase-isomerase (queuine synthetase)